ncbi:basic secretory family protein [Mucilaginibacter sp. UR6-11]|uniref:basic secretory family protein n=1 Tax=Mucilaginibacter sp. UR6-11 TaxID=1435644 RepID=UPI001E53E456|nr:basic secretory family protein [Mucilaginibacter sp. UR6-11]MCC8424274.1 basic secretory family protein [Mucilaginibacter sp. UR6-11]
MKKLLLIIILFAGLKVNAQGWEDAGKYITRDSITRKTYTLTHDTISRKTYTLIFINKDATFAQKGDTVKQRMIDAFFSAYAAEAETFNKNTLNKVTFIIDPDYKGVAATANGVVHFNPAWMLKKPTDIDVVTHEVMHIVQDYGNSGGPGWLTEGIADYVRAVFGVDNPGAKWFLPKFKPTQSYTDSYRVTARFFIWVERNVKPSLVVNLDARLRAHTYNDNTIKDLTGKTFDQLWADYAAANTPKG